MTPEYFEKQIAAYYSKLNYKIKMTPKSYDYGVDIIAEKESEKIAIQVKLYDVRISNYKDIMYLYAGCKYYDCTKAVFITNGMISQDAKNVSKKLEVEFFENWAMDDSLNISENSDQIKNNLDKNDKDEFGSLWKSHIIPLTNKYIDTITGKSNKIIEVNYNFLKRESSNGNTSKIDYSIFEQCYHHLKEKGKLTRDEINHLYTKRASALIFVVLAQMPFVSIIAKPKATLIYREAN